MKYQGHKYAWSKPFTAVYHNWELRTAHGGINFFRILEKEAERLVEYAPGYIKEDE